MLDGSATVVGQTTYADWRGTPAEGVALINALARYCACAFATSGARVETCASHRMLAHDQRALNGLVFARRMADRLRYEEWVTAEFPTGAAADVRAFPA